MKEITNYFIGNSKKIKILIEEIDTDFTILANKNKLLQVFINIIDNSISIANENTKILLQIKLHDKDHVQVKIYDQGKGISLDDHDRIFKRFYSDREVDSSNHTGLGLSIVKEIIQSFRGTIKLVISDKNNYSGACFIIILPVRIKNKNQI